MIRPRFAPGLALFCALIAACSTNAGPSVGATPAPPPTSAPSSAAAPTLADPWTADLETLDRLVRSSHPAPFTIHPESKWNAKLAEIRPQMASASPDEQLVLVASLVGLLDGHTYMFPAAGFHYYSALFYRFSDGWFVISAEDPAFIGTRLVSIGGHDVADVEATLRDLIPHDNESGFFDNEDVFSKVEYLHGAGIVADPAKPQYVLEQPDGTRSTVDLTVLAEDPWVEALGIIGDLVGGAPEAVARRGEQIWSRLDAAHRTLLIAVNDYGDMTAAATAMTAALDAGTADRVVLDLRYLRGGNGDFPLLTAVDNEPRLGAVGSLTVLIGRENVSAGTVVVGQLEALPGVLLVGEQTPARADNFLCPCQDIVLPNSGIVVSVPTAQFGSDDARDSIAPDVPMTLASADFFAGRDPVLHAALSGIAVP